MICYVFSPESFRLLGVIDKIADQFFEEAYADAGAFGFWCSLEYADLLKEDNIVWFGGIRAGVIEGVQATKSADNKMIQVSGHTAEIYLDRRTIYPTFSGTGDVSRIIAQLVSNNAIQPNDQERVFQHVVLGTYPISGISISYQKTGGNLLAEVSALCKAHGLGFHLRFDPDRFLFIFELYKTTNHTKDQQVNTKVILSSSLDEILSSDYVSSTALWKNVAYIAGEGEGTERKYALLLAQDDDDNFDYRRRELFVDARDLQSETDSGQISDAQYQAMLKQRGAAKLTNCCLVKEFNAVMRQNSTAYVYGVDYILGDMVTVIDEDLGVSVDAVVTLATSTKTAGRESLEIGFGYKIPTLYKQMKGAMM